MARAWSVGGNLGSPRRGLGGCGTQAAGLSFGGYIEASPTVATEEYDGTSWAYGGSLGASKAHMAGCGTQTAGLSAGGEASVTTEEYDGSAWSFGGDVGTSAWYNAAGGSQTAAVKFGGYTGAAPTAVTEEYDGAAWSAGGNLLAAIDSHDGCGTQTAGLSFGGASQVVATEEYDGSSWAAGGSLSVGRSNLAGCGTQTAGLSIGGSTTVVVTTTEEYNGSSWATGGDLNTARQGLAGAGAQDAGLSFGGAYSLATTEEYSEAANNPPSCSIAQDSIAHGLVYITPTASDTDGTVTDITIYWEAGQTTTGCTSGVSYPHTFTTNGAKDIYAVATDDDAATTESNHLTPTVTLNVAPSCSVNLDSTVHGLVTVTPTASDTDGTVEALTLSWGGGVFTNDCVSGQAYQHTYTSNGQKTILAIAVDDDGGQTESSSVHPTITLNVAPSCSIVQDSLVHGLIYVTPTASDTDGTIASLVITWGDGQTTTGCTSGVSYPHTYATGGQKTIYATAVDDDGASTQSSSLTPTVTLNVGPSCSIAQDSIAYGLVYVTPTVTDTDGTITDITIYWGGGVTTTGCTSGQSYSNNYESSGQKTIYAVATDDDGATTQSNSLTPTVTTLTLNITPDSPTVVPSGPLQLSADTVEGDTAVWEVVTANGGTITQGGLYTAPLVHGTYQVTVTSTLSPDAYGTVSIVVEAIPEVETPTKFPGANSGRVLIRITESQPWLSSLSGIPDENSN